MLCGVMRPVAVGEAHFGKADTAAILVLMVSWAFSFAMAVIAQMIRYSCPRRRG